jgi:hypothetical protein
MSDPGREFIDLLSAAVALGAFRSVLAVAVADEAANLSDEQLRGALMALDYATHLLVGGLPPGVLQACCGARLSPVTVHFSDRPPGRRCVRAVRSAPLRVAQSPAGRWLSCPSLFPAASRILPCCIALMSGSGVIPAPPEEMRSTMPESTTLSGTILASCLPRGGARVFTPLLVAKHGGEIMIDAQVANAPTIILDEAGASALFDLLGVWLA